MKKNNKNTFYIPVIISAVHAVLMGIYLIFFALLKSGAISVIPLPVSIITVICLIISPATLIFCVLLSRSNIMIYKKSPALFRYSPMVLSCVIQGAETAVFFFFIIKFMLAE